MSIISSKPCFLVLQPLNRSGLWKLLFMGKVAPCLDKELFHACIHVGARLGAGQTFDKYHCTTALLTCLLVCKLGTHIVRFFMVITQKPWMCGLKALCHSLNSWNFTLQASRCLKTRHTPTFSQCFPQPEEPKNASDAELEESRRLCPHLPPQRTALILMGGEGGQVPSCPQRRIP